MVERDRQPIPFSRPLIGEEEIRAVVEVLRSGWLTSGPKTVEFERDFARFLGDDVEAVAVNSATAGLLLALEALGIGPGDEVMVPVYTFTATAQVVNHLGARPVFVDVEADSLNLDPDLLERSLSSRTKAIMPVHFAGLPCRMDAILEFARRHDLKVVEDAAHALPARFQDRLVGSLDSDAAVFSFYANKTITTGEGGMIAARDPNVAKRCRIMRLHGIDKAVFDRYYERYRKTDKPSWHYQVVAPGHKCNLSDIASAIGIHQLARAEGFQENRQAIACRYSEALSGLPLRLPRHDLGPGTLHAWHLYVVRLQAERHGMSRDAFIDALRVAGIGTSVHFIPLHLHPYWRDTLGYAEADFPVALEAFQQAVSLPLFPAMTVEECDYVITTVREVLEDERP